MSFSRVKPSSWAFGEILTSAQMNTLDTDHANAIDGAAGGSYTPTSDIVITSGSGGALGACDVTSGSFTWTGTTNLPAVGSRTYSRLVMVNPAFNESDGWTFAFAAASRMAWYQNDVTSSWDLIFPLDNLIDKSTLASVDFVVLGDDTQSNSHGANFPTTPPKLHVYYQFGTVASSLGSHTLSLAGDYGGSVVTYDNLAKTINVPITGGAIDESVAGSYWCRVEGEAGANAVAGFTLLAVVANYTVTKITPGG